MQSKLLVGHLEREVEDVRLVPRHEVVGPVQGQAGLQLAREGGMHPQLPLLDAVTDLVNLVDATELAPGAILVDLRLLVLLPYGCPVETDVSRRPCVGFRQE